MTQRIYFAIFFCTALLLAASTQATAQNKDQQKNAQQQSAQKQKMQKQQSANQSGNKQATNSSQKASSAKNQNVQTPQDMFITSQKSSQVLASNIIGMTIQNKIGKNAKEIGEVNDLIMNNKHQLVGVVVSFGANFLGMGEKNVGITWKAIKSINPQKDVAVIKINKKQLKAAPSFKTKQEQKEKQKQRQQRKQLKKKMKQQQMQKQMPQQQKQPMSSSKSGSSATSGG